MKSPHPCLEDGKLGCLRGEGKAAADERLARAEEVQEAASESPHPCLEDGKLGCLRGEEKAADGPELSERLARAEEVREAASDAGGCLSHAAGGSDAGDGIPRFDSGVTDMPALVDEGRTTLCRHVAVGRKCPVGEGCKFAHSWSDLSVQTVVCPFDRCKVELTSERQCEEHMAQHHRKQPAQPLKVGSHKCPCCDKVCNSVRQLREHMDAHRKRGELVGDCAVATACRPRKVQLCRHHVARKTCPMAEGTCKFAHGWAELDVEVTRCPFDDEELQGEAQCEEHMRRCQLGRCGGSLNDGFESDRGRAECTQGGHRRVSLCRHFSAGRECPMEPRACRFAHGWGELDSTSAGCPHPGCSEHLRSKSQYEDHMRAHAACCQGVVVGPGAAAPSLWRCAEADTSLRWCAEADALPLGAVLRQLAGSGLLSPYTLQQCFGVPPVSLCGVFDSGVHG